MNEGSRAEDPVGEELLEVQGARVHNLRNIDVAMPRNRLVVITGLSGSGKSSLAFDTIYAEGQRRYMETFSAYARQFIGNLERPDVDKITGLSPVISIEQKTVSRNPRSTVGTITEIYDFLRLLYARVADAYSVATGKKMVSYTEQQIIGLIEEAFEQQQVMLLAPLVKGRKGHYRELFDQIRRQGYLQVRVDGEVREITQGMQLDRYKIHDVEVVVDQLKVNALKPERLVKSVQTALKTGKGTLMLLQPESEQIKHYSRSLMCLDTGISYPEPEPNTFSFNSPYGACPHCNGLGVVTEVDISRIIPEPRMTIRKGGIAPLGPYKPTWIFRQVEAIGSRYGFTLDSAVEDLAEEAIGALLYGTSEVLQVKNEYLGVISSYSVTFDGIVNFIRNQDQESQSAGVKRWASAYMNDLECPECRGTRLKKESLQFKLDERNIAELAGMSVVELQHWLEGLENRLEPSKALIAREILREIRTRIGFLLDVGVEYLSLNRPARSLSGGEGQRIRLATQIGSKLVGVLYILDEPSIGLHQRDNIRLIRALKDLRDTGNSVMVVEHDEEMIRSADWVVDIGPGAGRLGGRIVAQGPPERLMNCNTITCQYLSGKRQIAVPQTRRAGNGKSISLKGAGGHNLKGITLDLPLGMLVCVTGVSGSGKSSLINQTLVPILTNLLYQSHKAPLPYQEITGLKAIDKVIEIDQSPIGRTPRSNPATYTGVFDEIRKLFHQLPESRVRGYSPGRFSFNVKGGRCEECKGAGIKVIEMNFLPDVGVQCEVCGGNRYNRDTLEVRYKGKSINDVLNLTIDQAVEFFENIPMILRKIKTLQEVGLGYITLGQQSTTLSGGEAQRVKLASELSRKDTGKTLYILDEPTTGLHFEDIRVLMEVLNRLVDHGNTVLVIEHNLDVIKLSDHIIDLGPEGGGKGGYIVASGTPEEVARSYDKSHTGYFLHKIFNKV
ncbi:MAG TPA: excinuclease ABC subunit UvrA [Bacteroidales bacterium]|nr:excinuclease ABC subunit UvrA [Bacteroidales bacterium]HRZ48462.1 excinuclease ABC subunit UvrA [Bacteroidales bacterium]